MAVRVAGIGTALPSKVVTNHDLAAIMDTNDEWIPRARRDRFAPCRRAHLRDGC